MNESVITFSSELRNKIKFCRTFRLISLKTFIFTIIVILFLYFFSIETSGLKIV